MTLPLQIDVLTSAETDEIFKRATADTLAPYILFLSSRDVGDGFRVPLVNGAGPNGETPRLLKRNFNSAAKFRTKFIDVAADTLVMEGEGNDAKYFAVDGAAKKEAARRMDGDKVVFSVERAAPVILRWKETTHKTTSKVDGKDVETVVTDKLVGKLDATEAVQTRAPRAVREIVTGAWIPTGAEKGATVAMPDGRTAKLGKDGKWRAPKVAAMPTEAPPTENADNPPSANGATNIETGTANNPPLQTDVIPPQQPAANAARETVANARRR